MWRRIAWNFGRSRSGQVCENSLLRVEQLEFLLYVFDVVQQGLAIRAGQKRWRGHFREGGRRNLISGGRGDEFWLNRDIKRHAGRRGRRLCGGHVNNEARGIKNVRNGIGIDYAMVWELDHEVLRN